MAWCQNKKKNCNRHNFVNFERSLDGGSNWGVRVDSNIGQNYSQNLFVLDI